MTAGRSTAGTVEDSTGGKDLSSDPYNVVEHDSFDTELKETAPSSVLVLGSTGEVDAGIRACSAAMCGPRIFRTKWAYRLVMRWSSSPSFSERESNTVTSR